MKIHVVNRERVYLEVTVLSAAQCGYWSNNSLKQTHRKSHSYPNGLRNASLLRVQK